MVYWIEPLTLDQRVAGSIPVNAWHFLSFSKTLYPHCCSPPRCRNGYLVDANDICAWCGMCAPLKWRLARMLSRELRGCTMSAGLILNPVTGVIIHCKALWVVFHTRKSLYKNQLLIIIIIIKCLAQGHYCCSFEPGTLWLPKVWIWEFVVDFEIFIMCSCIPVGYHLDLSHSWTLKSMIVNFLIVT